MTQKVIGFHYTLTNEGGEKIDSSEGRDALYFLVGSGHIIPGLETKLVQMNEGEKSTIKVEAKDAYGELRDDLILKVDKKQFPEEGTKLNVGDQFQANSDPHSPIFTVVELDDQTVTIDGNHPLAGENLIFNVEIVKIRMATQDEIHHGHAHGEDGHGHHH